SNNLIDRKHYIRLRAVCRGWRVVPCSCTSQPFSHWILKTEDVGKYGPVEFVFMADNRLFHTTFPTLARKISRLIGCGGLGCLLAVPKKDSVDIRI
ncbi:hypothetical protein BAE44_0016348, partial [Dichanthelium oligosanthes]